MSQRYLIALGSNQRHQCHGLPPGALRAALKALDSGGVKVKVVSRIVSSEPLGPSRRRYANAATVVKTKLSPAELLALLKAIERNFGRRRGGQRWGARVLDLDIVLWTGGVWTSPGLTIPHIAFRQRGFVLTPASAIAPGWRDPVTGLTLRQLNFRLARRLTRPRPLPIGHAW